MFLFRPRPFVPRGEFVLAKFGRARKCTNLQLVHKPSTHVTLSCHLQWGAQIPGSFPLAVPRGTDAAPWMQSLYTYIQCPGVQQNAMHTSTGAPNDGFCASAFPHSVAKKRVAGVDYSGDPGASRPERGLGQRHQPF